MFCPACLTFNVNNEAMTQVGGTQYCTQHGVEALRLEIDPRGRGMRGPAMHAAAMQFSPPPQAIAPTAPPPAPPAPPVTG